MSIAGSIETMDFFDLDEDGISEIVVGRDDGHVEVYRIERGEHAPYKCADHVSRYYFLSDRYSHVHHLMA